EEGDRLRGVHQCQGDAQQIGSHDAAEHARVQPGEIVMRRWCLALLLSLVACGGGKQDEGIKGAPEGGPWYDTALDRDTSYLPLGGIAQSTIELQYGRVALTAYVPNTAGSA